jgi:hypothetical protein
LDYSPAAVFDAASPDTVLHWCFNVAGTTYAEFRNVYITDNAIVEDPLFDSAQNIVPILNMNRRLRGEK